MTVRSQLRKEGEVAIPNVSVGTSPLLVLTQFMKLVPGDENSPDELNQMPWYDPLDSRIIRMFETVKQVSRYTYQGEALTTVSTAAYGTHSGWYVILMYNGYNHPDEIKIGTELKIPDLGAIKQKLLAITSRRGELVTL